MSRVMVTEEHVVAFENFANNLSSGYVKRWKANSMLATIALVGMAAEGRERLCSYVHGCLRMEGFKHSDCDLITTWLTENHPCFKPPTEQPTA